MKLVKDYITDAEKEAIIIYMIERGWTLVEEQIHYDGKHLVFELLACSFEPSNPSQNPPTRIEHIEDFLKRCYP